MDYVPSKRSSRHLWLKGLSDNIAAEAVKFGAPAADATAVKAAADGLIAKMEATDAAAAVHDGARQQEAAAQAAAIAAIRAKVRNFKTLPLWPASGSEAVLQVKGSEAPFEPATYKPVFKVKIEGGQIRLDFEKRGVDALAFYTRLRGEAAFTRLATDTEPPYIDTRPLAQPGVPEVREYMARGMVGDEEVGLESDIMSITFAG